MTVILQQLCCALLSSDALAVVMYTVLCALLISPTAAQQRALKKYVLYVLNGIVTHIVTNADLRQSDVWLVAVLGGAA
jgi:hypothetical protein